MKRTSFEVNFDGIVGPTHNYAGLSGGNIASIAHRGTVSHPRAAALQGLAKMKVLADLGVRQGVFPPHERPALPVLRSLGFSGSDSNIVERASREDPNLLAACFSASAMWVANAATVAPSSDAEDGKVHFSPANLASKFHRSIEPEETRRILRSIFPSESRFVVHDPLPAALGDEGAANHARLAPNHAQAGLHLFVYGAQAFSSGVSFSAPKAYQARQTLEASQAVARRHGLRTNAVLFAQQNPKAIDAGVFHNDVISVGHEGFFLCHEQAFAETGTTIEDLKRQYSQLHSGAELNAILVPAKRISLADAVRSYLFNSQIVTLPNGEMALIASSTCEEVPSVRKFVQELASAGGPIKTVRFVDLQQSMQNGGGPACLRLRVVLTPEESESINPGVVLTNQLHDSLVGWVQKHYRETLTPADLSDPGLLGESRRALDELTQLLRLGSIYPFQRISP